VPLDAALSERMSRVRRRDTKPEVLLRRELHRRGLRYRVDVAPLAGMRTRADLVFGPSKVAVYVDGCFWHKCPDHFVMPKNNREWWAAKLEANVERDRRTDEELSSAGWLVIRIWEHQDIAVAANQIEQAVRCRRGHQAAR